jgi:hypothetical protein
MRSLWRSLVIFALFVPLATIGIWGCGQSGSPETGTQLEADEAQQLEEDPEAEETGAEDASVETEGPA